MFPEFVGQRLRCKFYVAVNILCKLAQCYYIEKLQLLTVLNEVIFFAITLRNMRQISSFFFLPLLEMIWALNLLKRLWRCLSYRASAGGYLLIECRGVAALQVRSSQ